MRKLLTLMLLACLMVSCRPGLTESAGQLQSIYTPTYVSTLVADYVKQRYGADFQIAAISEYQGTQTTEASKEPLFSGYDITTTDGHFLRFQVLNSKDWFILDNYQSVLYKQKINELVQAQFSSPIKVLFSDDPLPHYGYQQPIPSPTPYLLLKNKIETQTEPASLIESNGLFASVLVFESQNTKNELEIEIRALEKANIHATIIELLPGVAAEDVSSGYLYEQVKSTTRITEGEVQYTDYMSFTQDGFYAREAFPLAVGQAVKTFLDVNQLGSHPEALAALIQKGQVFINTEKFSPENDLVVIKASDGNPVPTVKIGKFLVIPARYEGMSPKSSTPLLVVPAPQE